MRRILHKPYVYWIIGIFISYIFINLLISGFYQTIPLIIAYAGSINWLELIISIIFSITIGSLVSINAVYAFIKYKERQQWKKCKEAGVLTGLGTLGGLATGFCPLCITGLFPLIFGLLGISFSFAALPLKGIEIQLLVIIILSLSLYLLNKK